MGVLDGLMRFQMFMIVPKRDKTHKNHWQLFAGCLMVGGTDDSCASPNKSRYHGTTSANQPSRSITTGNALLLQPWSATSSLRKTQYGLVIQGKSSRFWIQDSCNALKHSDATSWGNAWWNVKKQYTQYTSNILEDTLFERACDKSNSYKCAL